MWWCWGRVVTGVGGAGVRGLSGGRALPARRPWFQRVRPQDLDHWRALLGPQHVLTQDLQPYNQDWLRHFEGRAEVALRPANAQELSQVLSYCYERNIAVCPQGGNTGLVGGSVPVHDEVIVLTSRMNKISAFDDISGVVECGAGCILEDLMTFLRERDYAMPLDLGAKGSCQIGGNVATNAGGLRFLRYGSLRGSVLGLEVVMPNGEIMNLMKALPKDNTGFDLKQLFLGSEGTLGVITQVCFKAVPLCKSVNVAVLGLQDFPSVLQLFKEARHSLTEILSAFEFFDGDSLELVVKHLKDSGARDPLSEHFPFYVLIETSGSNEAHDAEKLGMFLERGLEGGLFQDAVLATDLSKVQQLWTIREGIPESLIREGYCYKYDISFPIRVVLDIVPILKERLAKVDPEARVLAYGHIGDANLHLNVVTPEFREEVYRAIEPFVFEWTAQQNGSVSAEHGLGFHKPEYLPLSKPEPAVRLMRMIKDAVDPNGIMNPYKMFPEREPPRNPSHEAE